MNKISIKLFEQKQVRSIWDEQEGKWWFSVVDIVGILTDSRSPGAYWRKLKQRLAKESGESVTFCHASKMRAADGKERNTDVADTEGILRLIQSIPSKKAEPFKRWLAEVGSEFIDEYSDPELAIDRAIANYRRQGYDEKWINQRLQSINIRKALTDEWDRSGVKRGQEYATLTDLMYKTWADFTSKEYKAYKNLKNESLRDNMTNTEIALNMLAEVTTTDISIEENPTGYEESADIAERGAGAAKIARDYIEAQTGKSAISRRSARDSQNLEGTEPGRLDN